LENILSNIARCIEVGKSTKDSPYPQELKGEYGASELTKEALENNISPDIILKDGLMLGMNNIGEQFAQGKAFIPNLLISAKAMNAAMEHLRPYFESGSIQHKGTLIMGTVKGDMHDIGKNVVAMIMKGEGWNVIDLGVDVNVEKFLNSVKVHDNCIVGLSALLTTTMLNMKEIVHEIKNYSPDIKVFIGGAPVSQQFSEEINADGYFEDPKSFAMNFR
jgi:methanogenic corrinoid protein MtbC1